MPKKEEKKIMYSSDEAAKPTTVTGWLDKDGRFWQNERDARFASHTHDICQCGKEMKRGYTKCQSCISVTRRENYFKLPLVEWDGNTPLSDYNGDKYFFSEDDLMEYCNENELNGEDLMLVTCEPIGINTIDSGSWEDCVSEDGDTIFGYYPELERRVKELNEFIETLAPVAYEPAKKIINYSYKYETES